MLSHCSLHHRDVFHHFKVNYLKLKLNPKQKLYIDIPLLLPYFVVKSVISTCSVTFSYPKLKLNSKP
jgi:hypothetical protein